MAHLQPEIAVPPTGHVAVTVVTLTRTSTVAATIEIANVATSQGDVVTENVVKLAQEMRLTAIFATAEVSFSKQNFTTNVTPLLLYFYTSM